MGKGCLFAINILASTPSPAGCLRLSFDRFKPTDVDDKQQMDITWRVIHSECERMGINIITGHTAGMRTAIIRWWAAVL